VCPGGTMAYHSPACKPALAHRGGGPVAFLFALLPNRSTELRLPSKPPLGNRDRPPWSLPVKSINHQPFTGDPHPRTIQFLRAVYRLGGVESVAISFVQSSGHHNAEHEQRSYTRRACMAVAVLTLHYPPLDPTSVARAVSHQPRPARNMAQR